MSRIEQKEEELREHLRDQIRFLTKSAEAFDKGDLAESKRLATSLRILFHDAKFSKSLLGQLRMIPLTRSGQNRGHMLFHDTGLKRERHNLIPTFSGLTAFQLPSNSTENARFVPVFHTRSEADRVKRIPFYEWWFNLILWDAYKNQFSRKSLILFVADQDGGAHVDPKLGSAYNALSWQNSLGWNLQDGGIGITVPFNNQAIVPEGKQSSPVAPSIRQITFEVLESLKDYAPEYFD